MRRTLLIAIVVALALLACASAALASELKVDTLEDRTGGSCSEVSSCSLREAIAAVNAGQVTGDVKIAIDVEGTIGIGDKGALKIDAPLAVSSVWIAGPTAEASDLTISGNEKSRILELEAGEVQLTDMTLKEGHVTSFAVDGDGGGAIYQEGGVLVLKDVRLTENKVASGRDGGAIAIEGPGVLTLIDSLVDHNTAEKPTNAQGNGGGIYQDAALSLLTLEDTEVFANNAEEGQGGGINQFEGNLSITGGRIAGNNATGGGGGISTDADGTHTTTIVESSIVENTAVDEGGGIWTDNGSGGVTIEKTAIEKNSTEVRGAGVYVDGPTTIVDSTVAHNEFKPGGEDDHGVGIEVWDDKLTLENSTVAMNAGVGLYVESGAEASVHASTIAANTTNDEAAGGLAGDGDFELASTIVAYNVADGQTADCDAEVTSLGHNVLGKAAGCEWTAGSGDQTNVLPGLGSLQDNGGPTETMAPVSFGSVAINHGFEPASTDQRGKTRPIPDSPAFTDVGAVEVQAPVNTELPWIDPSGAITPGTELLCEMGTWDPDTVENPQVRYDWFVEGEVVAEDTDTYETTAADAGKDITCEVAMNNGATVTEAISEPVHFGPATASLSPAVLDFGEREVDSGEPPAEQTLTLKNKGGEDLTVSSIEGNSSNLFPLDLSDCNGGSIVLASGESCEIGVGFEPNADGPRSSTITVQSNGGNPTAEAKGTGLAPVLTITPNFHDFGEVAVGTGPGAWFPFSVKNVGGADGPVFISEFEGDEFALDDDGCDGVELEPGQECTIEVAFRAEAPGAFSGELGVSARNEGSEAIATLSGTATQAVLSASPAELDFKPQLVGTMTTQTVTISNSGTGTAKVGSVALEGPGTSSFDLPAGGEECTGAELAGSETCTVEVAFKPIAAGLVSVNLQLEGDATTPTTVLIGGTGTEPPPPAEASAALTAPGPLTGNAAGELPIGVACAATGPDCQVTLALQSGGKALGSWSGTLAPGASQTAEVPLSPAARKQLG
ncbi:MAG TPA: choice-of-anchor D domain-containing protein, partial [Solirubrobacterales bacterium]|nr:choice-of-anchor D domain-containing protein [Solirubrobacterales bacterium]